MKLRDEQRPTLEDIKGAGIASAYGMGLEKMVEQSKFTLEALKRMKQSTIPLTLHQVRPRKQSIIEKWLSSDQMKKD